MAIPWFASVAEWSYNHGLIAAVPSLGPLHGSSRKASTSIP